MQMPTWLTGRSGVWFTGVTIVILLLLVILFAWRPQFIFSSSDQGDDQPPETSETSGENTYKIVSLTGEDSSATREVTSDEYLKQLGAELSTWHIRRSIDKIEERDNLDAVPQTFLVKMPRPEFDLLKTSRNPIPATQPTSQPSVEELVKIEVIATTVYPGFSPAELWRLNALLPLSADDNSVMLKCFWYEGRDRSELLGLVDGSNLVPQIQLKRFSDGTVRLVPYDGR